MSLRHVVELGVEEAYQLLTETFGLSNLPPLDAIENEDWGRDYLLAKFTEISPQLLARHGFTVNADSPDP